jgi:hypothetical protein
MLAAARRSALVPAAADDHRHHRHNTADTHPALLLWAAMTFDLTFGRGSFFRFPFHLDSLRGSSVKIGTIQRRLAWPLRKDDTHKSRSVIIFLLSSRLLPSAAHNADKLACREVAPMMGPT